LTLLEDKPMNYSSPSTDYLTLARVSTRQYNNNPGYVVPPRTASRYLCATCTQRNHYTQIII
jgi:hypothetical protein